MPPHECIITFWFDHHLATILSHFEPYFRCWSSSSPSLVGSLALSTPSTLFSEQRKWWKKGLKSTRITFWLRFAKSLLCYYYWLPVFSHASSFTRSLKARVLVVVECELSKWPGNSFLNTWYAQCVYWSCRLKFHFFALLMHFFVLKVCSGVNICPKKSETVYL